MRFSNETPVTRGPNLSTGSSHRKDQKMASQQDEYTSYVSTLPRPEDREAFKYLAQRDTRGEASDFARVYLESAGVIEQYVTVLGDITKDIDTQLAERKAMLDTKHNELVEQGNAGKQEWFREKAAYGRWRGGALRVKRSTEVRRRELKELIRKRNVEASDRKRDRTRDYETVLNNVRDVLHNEVYGEQSATLDEMCELLEQVETALGEEG
jgi:hypothetical protein